MEHTSVVHKAYHRAVVERLEAENTQLLKQLTDIKDARQKLGEELAETELERLV